MNKPLIVAVAVCGLLITAHAGVLSHYTFDSDYTDSSGNGNDGTFVDVGTIGDSGITTTVGEYKFGGGGLHLTEDRDYVAVDEILFGSTSGPYSFAFWAKRANITDEWAMILGDQSDGADFIALNNANYLRQRGALNEAVRQHDYAVTSDTDWHHYVVTGDGGGFFTGTMSLYLDGSLVESVDGKSTGFTINAIGAAYLASNNFDFEGQIDEVWVFDEVLTEAAAANLFRYNNPIGAPATAVLTYHFDSDYTDSSSSANDGTASGTATLTTDTNRVAVGLGALLLDGADASYVALSNSLSFAAADPWSVTFWAQRDENGNEKGMVLGERNTTDDFIWLNDNFTGLRFRSSTAAALDFTVAKDLDLHHYALVANGSGNLALYVDGVPVESLNGNTSFTIDTIGLAYPTDTTYHYAFAGVLDETRIYQDALTGGEILALYNEKPQPPPPVVTRLRVFLQAGQSNADGRATPGDLPLELQYPQTEIDFYYKVEGGSGTLTSLRAGLSETHQFGPEITFGRDINSMLITDSVTRVAIIKYANGGTKLSTQWYAGGDATQTGDGSEYKTFQNTVTSGLAALAAAYTGAVIEVEGMIWHQGESDTELDAHANAYAANLTDFIADIRATYGTDLPFVVGRLSSLQTYLNATRLETVRQAQTSVAENDPYVGLVDTDSFSLAGDHLHYNAAGQQPMGSAFARQLGYQLWMPDLFTPEQLAAGEAEPGADADSDGASNEDEFIAGTLPNDATSILRGELKPIGSDLFEIRYPGAVDRLFTVESTTNLVDGAWIDLLPWDAGSGAVVTRTITNSAHQSFVRVRAKLP